MNHWHEEWKRLESSKFDAFCFNSIATSYRFVPQRWDGLQLIKYTSAGSYFCPKLRRSTRSAWLRVYLGGKELCESHVNKTMSSRSNNKLTKADSSLKPGLKKTEGAHERTKAELISLSGSRNPERRNSQLFANDVYEQDEVDVMKFHRFS